MGEIIKKKLVIEGEKVHDVGYRLFLMDLADDFLLPCFSAKNKVKDGRQIVEVFVGGKEIVVEKFVSLAKKEYPQNSKVDKVLDYDYDEDIRSMESFSRSFSTSQLAKIAGAGVSMLGKQDTTIDLQKQMLGKQDKTVNIIREGNEKLSKEIRTGNEKVTGKLDRIHNDLSVNLKAFHKDTIARFDVVDDKYGKISENIGKTIYAINRTCDNTEKLLEKSERDRKDYRKSLDDLVGAIVKLAEKK